mmetsp:Transcript_111398/g.325870  ORF Transcript_111398/g.325870 Transcript_111398/m.325870 type:complete len:214 (-) Transcript_111398:94-735(-)
MVSLPVPRERSWDTSLVVPSACRLAAPGVCAQAAPGHPWSRERSACCGTGVTRGGTARSSASAAPTARMGRNACIEMGTWGTWACVYTPLLGLVLRGIWSLLRGTPRSCQWMAQGGCQHKTRQQSLCEPSSFCRSWPEHSCQSSLMRQVNLMLPIRAVTLFRGLIPVEFHCQATGQGRYYDPGLQVMQDLADVKVRNCCCYSPGSSHSALRSQ